jgi:hypothetical protein
MRARIWGLTLLLAAGCRLPTAGKAGAPLFVRPAHVSESMLTCAQATRAAREALLRMGYSISTVEAAKPESPGKVVGTVNTGWSPADPESGTLYTVTVSIKCSDAGSDLDAVTDEGTGTQLTFPQRFAKAVNQVMQRKQVAPHFGSELQQGLVIHVEPQRSGAALAAFGLDLPAAGVTPVRFEILNRSSRRYRFQGDGVTLITQEGEQVSALDLNAAAARMAKPGEEGEVASLLRKKMIADDEIPPGQSRRGYLYFNASAYRRASVVLTDVDSDESEGFSVEF